MLCVIYGGCVAWSVLCEFMAEEYMDYIVSLRMFHLPVFAAEQFSIAGGAPPWLP